MIEIFIAILTFAAGLCLYLGFTGGVVQLAGFEADVGAALAALGVILAVHGLFRRVRDTTAGETHSLRSRGLMMTSILAAVLLIAGGVGFFSQITIAGVPVGYHVAAEGLPLALFVLLLLANRKQSAIDLDASRILQSCHIRIDRIDLDLLADFASQLFGFIFSWRNGSLDLGDTENRAALLVVGFSRSRFA